MARWSVGRVRSVAPSQGTDADKAYAIHFAESDQAEPQITMEYASGGGRKYASHAHARKAVEPYLDLESPPRWLVLSRTGEAPGTCRPWRRARQGTGRPRRRRSFT